MVNSESQSIIETKIGMVTHSPQFNNSETQAKPGLRVRLEEAFAKSTDLELVKEVCFFKHDENEDKQVNETQISRIDDYIERNQLDIVILEANLGNSGKSKLSFTKEFFQNHISVAFYLFSQSLEENDEQFKELKLINILLVSKNQFDIIKNINNQTLRKNYYEYTKEYRKSKIKFMSEPIPPRTTVSTEEEPESDQEPESSNKITDNAPKNNNDPFGSLGQELAEANEIADKYSQNKPITSGINVVPYNNNLGSKYDSSEPGDDDDKKDNSDRQESSSHPPEGSHGK